MIQIYFTEKLINMLGDMPYFHAKYAKMSKVQGFFLNLIKVNAWATTEIPLIKALVNNMFYCLFKYWPNLRSFSFHKIIFWPLVYFCCGVI